jgi:hypothetical protein
MPRRERRRPIATFQKPQRERLRIAILLTAFAVLFATLTVSSSTQKSATWDEPQHLVAGCAMLMRGDYRTDPEHPPFGRSWAALPLLWRKDLRLDTAIIDRASPVDWVGWQEFFFAHDFMYRDNDADALLYRARFMVVLLGIALGIMVFAWAYELFGFWIAAAVLALFAMEPNLLAHSALVTTDLPITCFVFGAIYFLWRTARRQSMGNIAGLIAFFAVAHVTKFSAAPLGPIVLALLIVAVCVRAIRAVRAALLLAVMVAVTFGSIWAAYRFRYLPSASPAWRFEFQTDATSIERIPKLTRLVGWIDAHRLLPNAYTQGFLLGQTKAQKRSAFFHGKFSNEGWWYFFPVAFAIKTPVAVVLLFVAGVSCCLRIKELWRNRLYLLLPVAAFLGLAMVAKLNIGLRHVLPVYPFVLLLAGVLFAELARKKWEGFALVACIALLATAAELIRIGPNHLAFFNEFVGGPRNGYKWLADSNLDWGQDLKRLKYWMQDNRIARINLSYFGTADPAYYGINCTQILGAPFFAKVEMPRLPGYVAVSVTTLSGVYFNERERAIFRPLLDREPDARIGYSIHVYWLDRPWWM